MKHLITLLISLIVISSKAQFNDDFSQMFLDSVNKHRTMLGIDSLQLDEQLHLAAKHHTTYYELLDSDVFILGHNEPTDIKGFTEMTVDERSKYYTGDRIRLVSETTPDKNTSTISRHYIFGMSECVTGGYTFDNMNTKELVEKSFNSFMKSKSHYDILMGKYYMGKYDDRIGISYFIKPYKDHYKYVVVVNLSRK